MRIRTIYYKVKSIAEAANFWESFLDIKPNSKSARWLEFQINDTRLAFLLNDFEKSSDTTNCVPVFEFTGAEFTDRLERAKALGAEIVIDGMNDPNMQCIVLRDICGNEFELCQPH